MDYKCHGTIAECLECPYTDECDRDVTLEEEKILDNLYIDISNLNIGQLRELRNKAESKKEYNRYANAIYRQKNKLKIIERQNKWIKEHIERNRELQKKYYESHKEEIKNRRRKYYIEHRDEILERRKKKRNIS